MWQLRCLLLLTAVYSCTSVKVQVAQGTLEGAEINSVTGNGTYYSFKGIPYAKPPIAELRFQAPQDPAKWTDVRSALEHGSICYQSFNPGGSEDCLYLNVYSPPNIKPAKPYPVMVYFHGGGFVSGSGNSDLFSPDFLIARDVILVTVNFRLEVLGFLSLQTPDVPGNNGLKDQVAALKWVKNNIQNFGGDSTSVTILGQSSGAASVGYHLVSPLSNGLFQRAVLMSGSPLSDWARTPYPRRQAYLLGQKLGINTTNDKELLTFLKATDVKNLVNQGISVTPWDNIGNFLRVRAFAPVVETAAGPEGKFLSKSASQYIDDEEINDVEVMAGYVTGEGLIAYLSFSRQYDLMNRYAEYFLTKRMAYTSIPEVGINVGKSMKAHYLGETVRASPATDAGISDFFSWSAFKYDILQFINSFPGKKSHYLYKFSATTERNWNKKLYGPNTTVDGVCHNDDLPYLFHQPASNLTLDTKTPSYQIIQQMTKLWTNFAKTGNPTPDDSLGATWEPFTIASPNYLEIGTNALTAGSNLDAEEFSFIDDQYQVIYEKYYKDQC